MHFPPVCARACLYFLFFCITKDYVDRDTLIGLWLPLNLRWNNTRRSPVTKNYLGHLKHSPDVFLEIKDDIVCSELLKVI